MISDNYIENRDRIINTFSQKIDIQQDEPINYRFNMVSASLSNFLPHINFADHENIFKNILVNQQLSLLEQSTYSVLDYISYEGLNDKVKNILGKTPSLICTFHTGSYRAINHFLTAFKIPYSLVISKQVIATQGQVFNNLYNDFPASDKENGLNLIDAETSVSGLQMLRELKKGRSLLLYIDGNTGAGKETLQNDNRCIINFLGQQIFARKGIAYLAHIARVPVIPVASYRKSPQDIRLRFFAPIIPKPQEDKTVFVQNATQQIYNHIEPIIEQYPDQWEAWLYLYKVANISNPVPVFTPLSPRPLTDQLVLNSKRFGIFRIGDSAYLLNKTNYNTYEIDAYLHAFLTDPASSFPQVNNDLIERLYSEGVLTCK